MEPSGTQTPATSSESTAVPAGPLNAVDETGSLISAGTLDGSIESRVNRDEDAANARYTREAAGVVRRRILKFALLGLALAACGGLIVWQLGHKKAADSPQADASVRYKSTSIPIAGLDTNSGALSVTGAQTLSINGQLNVNNSLVLAPTTRPDGAVTGQLYYDRTANRLSYYNGSSFQTLLAGGDVVSTSLGGASGAIATGSGLAVSGQTLNNTGVLTLQGQSGNVTLAAGPGIVVNGTTLSNSGLLSLGGLSGNIAVGTGLSANGGALSNSGVTSVGGANGDIAVGSGLSATGGTLKNSGIISAVGAGSITVTNDGNGNITIDGPNGTGGGATIASPGGTIGKIAKFTGVQTIADSLLSDNGTTVTVGGALSVTGTVSLSTPLAVTSGGTGANSAAGARTALGVAKSGANSDITSLSGLTSALSVAQGGTGVGTLATNGVIVGNGTSAPSSVVAGSGGLCLVSSTGAAPTWSTCPGSGGVSSLDGGTGALTLNNSSLTGSTVTIDNATTAAKGIASFNSTNFSVSSGAVNTIQNINTAAAPTFGQLVLTSSQAANPMLVINNTNLSASGALLDLQLNGSSRFSVTPGGNVSSAGTINGQTISNATSLTGSLSVTTGATVGGGLGVTGSLSVNTITPTSSLTVGAAGQSFTLQGNASSTLTSTSGGNTTTLGFQTPTANVTYNFPTATAGTYSICTTAGNCVGVGGGVTSTGGTNGKIAKFTGSGTIADSIISESGTTVTVAGALSVNTITPSGALTIGAAGQNLTLQGATVSLSATASGTTNSLTFAAPSGSNKTVTVPNASGTVAVSASGPLSLDANGNLTCPTCLSTGGSGGTTGVSSVNGLSGGLTLQGSSASSVTNGGTTITINDASSTVKGLASFNSTNLTVTSGSVNTVQDIAVGATPTFAGLNLTAALSVGNGGTGATTAANARTNLGAAKSGANSDITSLSGLTTAISVAQGGTGVTTTPTNGQILIGNGSSFSLNTLSAGTGVTITNTAGGVTIAAGGAGTCAGCANASLNNLSSVAINTSLLPGTAGSADLGSGTLPFGQLFLAGTSASPGANNFKITGVATGSRVITLPDASGTVAVSASGNIALSASGNLTFTGTLGVASGGTGANTLSSNGVLLGNGTGAITSVVAGSGGLCLTSVTSSAPTWATCPGSGSTGVTSLNGLTGALSIADATGSGATVTLNNASTSVKGIASFNSNNFSATSGAINTIQDINTTAAPTFGQLALTSAQATSPMLTVNNTNASASGNLIDLQLNGSSKLHVTPAGNLVNSGTIAAGGDISTSGGNFSGGTLNGQTISSTASFTGSVAVATGLTVGSTLQVNTITPTSSLTVGAAGQSFLLQGNASSTLTATNSGSTTTVGFQTPTANVTYSFAAAAAGSYNVCTTAGNCVGVGGGVTSTGGTSGKIAKFTGSGTIADSIISESGTTITVGGSLSVNTLTPSGALTVGATGQNLTLQGATVSLTATASGVTNTLTFATPATTGKTITLPNASGTVAVSASGPLSLDASGNLTCLTCLTSGGGGGSAGVSSLNGLTGGLTLQGSSAGSVTNGGTTITINDASSSTKGLASFNSTNLTVTSGAVNTVQDIAVTSTPTFGGLTLTTALTVANGGTGANTAANARTNLGAAKSGANSDITSLSGLTTALSVAQGGTGVVSTPTNGQILIGNGSGFSLNTLSAGTGVTIANSAGGITISAGSAGTCAGCATTSLNNLSGVAINTSLLPGTAGAADLGSGTLPFGQLFLSGTSASPATNNFKITGASTSGTRTITLPDASGTVAVSASGNIALSATGNITFSGVLGVSSGGTGANTLASNGVLLGNANSAISSLVAGSGNLCLISVSSAAPTWSACPGTGGVTSVDTQTGALTIANSTGGSGTITIDNASTSAKGIASFSSTNFSVTSGAVNTIQNINSSAAPTFSSLSLTAASSLALGSSSSATGTIVFKGATGTGTLTLQGPSAPNTGNFTLSLPTITANDTVCTVGQANCGVNSIGTIDSQTASANGGVISGGSLYLQSASATNPGLVNTGSQTFAGDKLFKSGSNSVTAFQVQNSTSASVFDVDTTNKRIGIGTNTPGRTFDVSINTSSTSTLPIRLSQAGAGDIGIEYQTSSSNFYEGIDGSDGQFKITSSTAANGTISVGNTLINTFDTDANSVDTSRVQTGATGGTLSSLSINVQGVDASPNNHMQLVIYSDNGSGTAPVTRLGYTPSFVPTVGWNTVSLTGVTIAPSTYYWVGFGTDGNNYVNAYTDAAQHSRFGANYAFGTPPSTWVDAGSPSGTLSYDEVMNIAVTGSTDNFSGTPLFTLSDAGQAKFQNATDSTTAFQLQSASGTSLFVADTTNATIKISGTTSTFATLEISNAHFSATQTNPPTAAVATCTGTPSVVSGSTDSAGSFSIAATSAAACKVTVTFNKAYATAPKSVLITPKSNNYGAVQPYVSSTTTTTFVVTFAASATSGQTYQFYYWVIQ
jgi:hypothetical protein